MTTGISESTEAPIAIGAIGGSGSRVLAKIIQCAGVSIGAQLNESMDNLQFTERFKVLDILHASDDVFDRLLYEFEALSLEAMTREGKQRWGWKEPNTHVVLDRLLRAYPQMRYVHLLRNGLDMACSPNQNQVRLWGSHFLGRAISEPPTPGESLSYFCEVHRKVQEVSERPENRGRVLMVEYEALCENPQGEIARLLDFLGLSPEISVEQMSSMVRAAPSIGRGRALNSNQFRLQDIMYLRDNFPHMLFAEGICA